VSIGTKNVRRTKITRTIEHDKKRRDGISTGVIQGEEPMAGKLRVHVDQDKCQGHSRCKSLAPELFNLDEFGNAHEIGDGTVPAGLEEKAWLAQTNCPELAVEIIEE
jgi:ferredoxin